MFSSKSLRCPRAPGAELNLGSGSTGFSYSPCRTAEEMMMSLISHRAQRRVQGRRSSPSLCCAPGWGQGQQWLLCAAGPIPTQWAGSCSVWSSKAPSVTLPVQWPCVDGPRSGPCVPAGLGSCWVWDQHTVPSPSAGPAPGAFCLLPCAELQLQELCCFPFSSVTPFGWGCRDCAFWCLLLISCQIFPLENIVP